MIYIYTVYMYICRMIHRAIYLMFNTAHEKEDNALLHVKRSLMLGEDTTTT